MVRLASTTRPRGQLDLVERLEIARMLRAGHKLSEIGNALGRHRSTVWRELARNGWPDRPYLPYRADHRAGEKLARPKCSKIAANPALRARLQELLSTSHSPEQAAGRVRQENPDDDSMHISHESVYQAIYVFPRGELDKVLTAHPRTRTRRKARNQRAAKHEKIPGLVPISERPAEVEERVVPGHHEGDLILGTLASKSAIGTIVERTTSFLTLVHLPDGKTSEAVTTAITAAMAHYPPFFTKTLTWDRGSEMTNHATLAQNTGMKVYFADPYKPWQRGANENTNGLLRHYFPKYTDLSVYTDADLALVQDELNNRARKRLGYRTPAEAFATLIEQDERQRGVAPTP